MIIATDIFIKTRLLHNANLVNSLVMNVKMDQLKIVQIAILMTTDNSKTVSVYADNSITLILLVLRYVFLVQVYNRIAEIVKKQQVEYLVASLAHLTISGQELPA